MRKILLAFGLLLAASATASAQCNGNFSAGQICGTVAGGAPGPIAPASLSPLIIPIIAGGTAPGSSLTLEATTNGSPSGEVVNILGATVNINANHGGASTVVIGTGGSGAILELYSLNGSGPQSWEVPSGGVGTITFPPSSGHLATLDLSTTQTWIGNNTYNTPIVFTGGVNVPSVGTGEIGANSNNGLLLIGQGVNFDVSLLTRGGALVCGLVAGTVIWECVVNPGANTTADSLILANASPSTSGNQQFSPALHFLGTGWKTNATAASQEADFIVNEQPIQGAANPNSTLVFSSQVNGTGFNAQVVMTDGGGFPSLSTAVGGPAALVGGAAGDLQVGRSANLAFIFFGTAAGNGQFIGLNSLGNWTFGGNSTSNTVGFGTGAAETAVLQSTNNVSPSGDSLTLKATTVNLATYGSTVCSVTGNFLTCGGVVVNSSNIPTNGLYLPSANTPTITAASTAVQAWASTFTEIFQPLGINTAAVITTGDKLAVSGQATVSGKLFLTGLTAGSGTKALCLNAAANEVQTDTSATICGISALRYKNLIAEITPDQGLGILSLHGEAYRYKPDLGQDSNIHVSLLADDMAELNPACASHSSHGVENYMDRCFEAYQVAFDKKVWEEIQQLKRSNAR